MAYSGSTAATPNPPNAVVETIGSTGGRGSRIWLYKSTHIQTDVDDAGFITDGLNLGMQLGDIVLVQSSTTYIMSIHTINTRSSTGVTLSAGLLVSSAS